MTSAHPSYDAAPVFVRPKKGPISGMMCFDEHRNKDDWANDRIDL
jgi:hypothetical protein